MNANDSYYVALDVDVESDKCLEPLLTELQGDIFCINRESDSKTSLVTLELNRSPGDRASPCGVQGDMLDFLAHIDRLSPEASLLWRDARGRAFNVGVQAGSSGAYELTFDHTLLARLAESRASLVVTVYGAATRDSGTST